jgi:hypothetical protein
VVVVALELGFVLLKVWGSVVAVPVWSVENDTVFIPPWPLTGTDEKPCVPMATYGHLCITTGALLYP